jgi:hypothetical protein
MMFYSPSAGAFYDPQIHEPGAIPQDAVAITRQRHAELLAGQTAGGRIIAGASGRPRLDLAKASITDQRAAAMAAIRREASRRIHALAPPHRQINDAALIAEAALQIAMAGETTVDIAPLLARRAAIDALRAAARALISAAATFTSPEAASFDPAADRHWSDPAKRNA